MAHNSVTYNIRFDYGKSQRERGRYWQKDSCEKIPAEANKKVERLLKDKQGFLLLSLRGKLSEAREGTL